MSHTDPDEKTINLLYDSKIIAYRGAMQERRDLIEMVIELHGGDILKARAFIDGWYDKQYELGRWKE